MKSPTGIERAAKFRTKMRTAGLKETTVWVPQHRLEEFRAFANVLRVHPDAKLVASVDLPPRD